MPSYTIKCSEATMSFLQKFMSQALAKTIRSPNFGMLESLKNANDALKQIPPPQLKTIEVPVESDNCSLHPNYKGLRKTKTDCKTCNNLYQKNRPK